MHWKIQDDGSDAMKHGCKAISHNHTGKSIDMVQVQTLAVSPGVYCWIFHIHKSSVQKTKAFNHCEIITAELLLNWPETKKILFAFIDSYNYYKHSVNCLQLVCHEYTLWDVMDTNGVLVTWVSTWPLRQEMVSCYLLRLCKHQTM